MKTIIKKKHISNCCLLEFYPATGETPETSRPGIYELLHGKTKIKRIAFGKKCRSTFGEADVAPTPPPPPPPPPPHPTTPTPLKRLYLFQVDETNIRISSKAYAFSQMMHEKWRSKGTHSLYTFIKSEVRK